LKAGKCLTYLKSISKLKFLTFYLMRSNYKKHWITSISAWRLS